MGVVSSSFAYKRIDPTNLSRSNQQIVDLMMPLYYTKSPVTEEDIITAKDSWSKVVDDSSPEFQRIRALGSCPYESCIALFYDTFYRRLFDIHPLCKPMFHGLKSQGKFLVKMIGMLVSSVEDEGRFQELCINLVDSHNARGVKAIEYGMVGEVLFYTLEHSLGTEIYTKKVSKVWAKIFSRLLTIVMPLALNYEIDNGEAQMERMRELQIETASELEEEEKSKSVSIDPSVGLRGNNALSKKSTFSTISSILSLSKSSRQTET